MDETIQQDKKQEPIKKIIEYTLIAFMILIFIFFVAKSINVENKINNAIQQCNDFYQEQFKQKCSYYDPMNFVFGNISMETVQ